MLEKYGFNRSSSRDDVNYTDYYWFKNGFSKEELTIIESMTKELPFQDAVTGEGDESKISEYRKSRIKWCPQNKQWRWVYSKLHDMIIQANNEMWKFDLSTMNEQIQYTEYYGTQEGGYNWHMDCGTEIQNQRKISVTVQLSDPSEYDNGDLQFNIGRQLTAPRVQGAAVIFPSFYLHRVTPVSKGIRKSFVLWVGGEPYR
jgi:PKHD-type hydroxylase